MVIMEKYGSTGTAVERHRTREYFEKLENMNTDHFLVALGL